MFNIAICDDEAAIREQLQSLLLRHKRAREMAITTFDSGESLCGQLMNGIVYDLIILDIEFPGLIDGVSVGAFLRNKLKDSLTQILYISGNDGYEQQLFDNRPLNFLRKPINEAKLLSIMDQVLDTAQRDMRTYTFLINRTVHRLLLRDIIYFESLNRQVILHARQGNYAINGRLDDLEPPPGFVRIHRSFLVNGLYIWEMKFDAVILNGGDKLPISRSYYAATREFMLRKSFPTTE